jgi:hypothetical protein
LIIRDPKSGKEQEVVFIPQKVADRLREYARQKCKNPNDRIFPISYEAARIMVLKSGNMVGVYLRPHDLRRHAAAYASRSGVPIEIISKKLFSGTRICQPLSYIWVKSATPKRSGGLKICMHKILQGDPFSEITLFLKGYNLSIPRFQLSDILVFIAESTTGDQGAGNDDITKFLRTRIFPSLLEIVPVLKQFPSPQYLV